MNKIILGLFILLFTTSNYTIAQEYENVQWASKLIGFSSEYNGKNSKKQYKAIQILGKPDVLPAYFASPCAWSPSTKNNENGEWITVSFDNPISISQVAVGESYNPGSITHIYAYDTNNQIHPLYRNENVTKLNQSGRMFRIFVKPTPYKVSAIKISMNTSKVDGWNHIDCIGISSSETPINALINETKNFDVKLVPEKLPDGINSTQQEISPIVSPDGKTLYFTRADHPENFGYKRVIKNGKYTDTAPQDVWYAELEGGVFKNAKNIGSPINTEDQNSSFSISPDGNTMLLNNKYLPNGKLEKGLSITKKVNNEWQKPIAQTIEGFENQNKYSEFCLSYDGKILIMAIETDEAVGGKDLYFSIKKGENLWSKPKHMGTTINTPASETSPFLAPDGTTLYFSTSGFSGYGLNDIYVSRRLDNSWQSWSTPQNMGSELNSNYWEAYFSIQASGQTAYFIRGNDIYKVSLSENNKPKPVAMINGKVIDAMTKEPVASIIIIENAGTSNIIAESNTHPVTGAYKNVLQLGKDYAITAEAKGYFPATIDVLLKDQKDFIELEENIEITPLKKGAKIRLSHIYFSRSSYRLLSNSYPELAKLAKALEENPNVVISLEGHTEPYGNSKALLKLSENRVNAVKKYLVSKGIDKKRIEEKAYGGTMPIAKGRSEAARQLNRRVEVKVL